MNLLLKGDPGEFYLDFGLRNFSEIDKQKIFNTCFGFFSTEASFSVD